MNTAVMTDRVDTRREERKVLAATLVGTTIEWYDFFIYAQAAALVLVPQFFAPLGETSPALAQIVSFATIGLSFVFRPLGAFVGGWLGDWLGRKIMLVVTVLMMGGGTFLIGVLPNYAAIGVAAPIILILLRVIQGISAGGEWGGAALMAVEHAPRKKRSLFGSYPQMGVPLGMIVATAVMFGVQAVVGGDAFAAWGWRIPFLLSIVLIVVGYLIRRAVAESPVFVALQERKQKSATPVRDLFRKNSKEVISSALLFIANNACGYILLAFCVSYLTHDLGLALSPVLFISTIAAISWLLFTFVGGWLGDKWGRIRTFAVGYAIILVWAVPMWLMIDTASLLMFFIAAIVLTVGLGLTYGPQAALYAETFPADIRYSGVSVSYAIGAVLGGAFAPMIAESIMLATGQVWHIGLYIIVLTVISLVAASRIKDRQGCDLHMQN